MEVGRTEKREHVEGNGCREKRKGGNIQRGSVLSRKERGMNTQRGMILGKLAEHEEKDK